MVRTLIPVMASRRHILGAMVVAGGLMGSGPSISAEQDDPRKKLGQIERELDESEIRARDLREEEREIGQNVGRLQSEMVATAARAQAQEDVVTELEGRLGTYEAEERARRAALEQRRSTTERVLAALRQVRRLPPETVFASPGTAIDSLRTSILLSAVVPELERRAGELRAELAALGRIRAEIGAERDQLSKARGHLGRERLALDRLIQRQAILRERTAAERRQTEVRMAALAADASNLQALIAKLEEDEVRQRKADQFGPAPEFPPFSKALGTLPLPVRGLISVKFGDANRFGAKARGITIDTRPGAQVIAPHDGRIVFAGHYRGYGQLLIIAHGEGYHTLMAGIARIDGTVGQLLLAGEPVGLMGQLRDGKPELYIELRHRGDPIDPTPWLAPAEIKVSG